MKLLPEKKILLTAVAIAFVLNIGELFRVDGIPKLIGFAIDTLIYGVLVVVLIRIVMWLGKKLGKGK